MTNENNTTSRNLSVPILTYEEISRGWSLDVDKGFGNFGRNLEELEFLIAITSTFTRNTEEINSHLDIYLGEQLGLPIDEDDSYSESNKIILHRYKKNVLEKLEIEAGENCLPFVLSRCVDWHKS
jgi:hypothetical protein